MQSREFTGDYASSDADSDAESAHLSSFNSSRRKSLTRASQSEPHLDIPHFVHGQGQHVPSLNKVLSGLFEVDSALSTPLSHSRRNHNNQLPAVASSLSSEAGTSVLPRTVSSPSTTTTAPLRKSSSATDWTSSALIDTSDSIHQFTPSYHHEQSGLVMTTTLAGQSDPTLVPVRQNFDQQLATSHLSNTSNPQSGATKTMDSQPSSHYDGMLGVFWRGFFAKPVIRSEEENYRYLMALDR